jgi:hypothetical protein
MAECTWSADGRVLPGAAIHARPAAHANSDVIRSMHILLAIERSFPKSR